MSGSEYDMMITTTIAYVTILIETYLISTIYHQPLSYVVLQYLRQFFGKPLQGSSIEV